MLPSRPRVSARSRASSRGPRDGRKRAIHSHGARTGATAAFMMRPTTTPFGKHAEVVVVALAAEVVVVALAGRAGSQNALEQHPARPLPVFSLNPLVGGALWVHRNGGAER